MYCEIYNNIYLKKVSAVNCQPSMVIVQFPTYLGPSFLPDEENCVPILPMKKHHFDKKDHTRTAFPLLLGYALTIHKVSLQFVCMYVCMYVCMNVCMYVYICIYIYIYIYIYICVCVCVCVFIYVYIYIYICIHIYIYNVI